MPFHITHSPVGSIRPPRRSPQSAAEELERRAVLPEGQDDRFVGYGIIGETWSSGHVLGLRRWPASSVGPAYTSVWHRAPDGTWRLYSDVADQYSCSRYIGRMVSATMVSPIRLTWPTPWALRVEVSAVSLTWEMEFAATPATLAFGWVRRWLPDAYAGDDRALRLLQWAAPSLLGAGSLRLLGLMPNGQRFRVVPRRVWKVSTAQASLEGVSLGVPARSDEVVRLGDFVLPHGGLLAFATARFR